MIMAHELHPNGEFVTVSAHWIRYQKEFAKKNEAKIILLSCGHYVHYYESERIAKEIKKFAKENI